MNSKRALTLLHTSHPLGMADESTSALASPAATAVSAEVSTPVTNLAAAPVTSIDAPLLLRVQKGDGAAFRAIFERHGPGVRRYLGDLLRDDAAADEATQETFVRAYDSLSSLREAARLQSWLFGIARNVFLEHCRARKESQRLLAEPDEESEPIDDAPTPDTVLLHEEADRVLTEALTHVGEPRKSALLLRLDHGLSYEDISAVMGWPVSKVKNEIHRARLQLRAQLSRYLGGSK
jgi:RNA polymerase sigma-70 factor (ECF subfamily)